METEIQLSPKQIEYINNMHHRWGFKIGATQCGKTFIDVQFVIPHRIVAGAGKKGLNVILGVSKETIERNVLEPMRDIWGDKLVSQINSRNFATLFGEKVYCLGAEKVTQVSKLRGAKFKYAYVDEIVDIHEQVFQLLKSRLSLPYSCCDASGNPSYPSHFIKEFIDSAEKGVDVYCQQWTLYDNPFLDPSYVRAMEVEFSGTIFYNRYILGEWTQAEGLVYPLYLDALVDTTPDAVRGSSVDVYEDYALSIDYGIQNAFAALLWGKKEGVWYCFRSYYHSGRDTGRQKTDEDYKQDMVKLVDDLPPKAFVSGLYTILDPSATSFIVAMKEPRVKLSDSPREAPRRMFRVVGANNDVFNGINNTARCMQKGLIKISRKACPDMVAEFGGYVWDQEDRPLKEDDHAMDALRYFVNTKNLVKPRTTYISPFGGTI